ncbi:MAG: GTPase ObgE [Parachlamydiales bacterium]|nr:GTPase ObgE [Parachlamydiales bacterium]
MFVDRAKVTLMAGKGGNGVVAWRREKYIPKGGPAGGNGGTGGSVIFRADEHTFSLEEFRYKRNLKAEDGLAGGANQRQGRCGKDLLMNVPLGTLIKDAETGNVLYDLTEHGQQQIVCNGGGGGRGNATFKSSTNRAPSRCTEGREGEGCVVELELKLIADVGLVGFPNAGKSTLIKSVTAVNVKTAPYPFTTLKPNLGFLLFEDYQKLIIADIPGIIQGAHLNRGLGLEFLKHIERTKVLVYVIDASGIDGRNPYEDFQVLQNELKAYGQELLQKPFIVVLNKSDCPESEEYIDEFKTQYSYEPSTLHVMSAQEKLGIQPLKNALRELVLTPYAVW